MTQPWEDFAAQATVEPEAPAERGPWDDYSAKPLMPNTDLIGQSARANMQAAQRPSSETGEMKVLTPEQKLDAGVGMPASQMLGSPKPGQQLSPEMRAYLMGAYENGTAIDVEDFMQAAIPAAAEATSKPGFFKKAGKSLLAGASDFSQGFYGLLEEGAALTRNPGAQAVFGQLKRQTRGFGEYQRDTMGDISFAERSAWAGLSSVMSTAPGLLMSYMTGNPAYALGTAGGTSGGIAAGEALEKGKTPEQALTYGATVGGIEAATELLPAMKLFGDLKVGTGLGKMLMNQAVRELPGETLATIGQDFAEKIHLNPDQSYKEFFGQLKEDVAATLIATIVAVGTTTSVAHTVNRVATAPDNLKQMVGNKLKKAVDQVTDSDIAQAIRDGFKGSGPSAKDFSNVSALTGISEKTYRDVYRETGVSPTQAFTDMEQHAEASEITAALVAGKIPEVYKRMAADRGEEIAARPEDVQESMTQPATEAVPGIPQQTKDIVPVASEDLGIPERMITEDELSTEEMTEQEILAAETMPDGRQRIYPANESHLEANIIDSQTRQFVAKNPPKLNNDDSIFNQIYRSLWNELDPIQKLPDLARERGAEISDINDTKLLSTVYSQTAETTNQNLLVGTTKWDDKGNVVFTGEGLKQIFDDLDTVLMPVEKNVETRRQDFNDFLISQRYLLDLKDADGVRVTEEQLERSVQVEENLREKYGDKYIEMQDMADRIYGFQRRVLENLVSSGVMSKELFDQVIADNPHYVPLQRIMDEEFGNEIAGDGVFTNARVGKLIKKIKGSEREEKNVFYSIVKNTAIAMELSARNRVAKSVGDLSAFLPEYIQETRPPIVKKGTVTVMVAYDPKLRAKLTEAAKFFGGDVEYMKSVRQSKGGYVLGSYTPMENLVRMRIGVPEGVLAHEVGHLLDHRIGLKEKMLQDPDIKKELKKLALGRINAEVKLMRGEEGIKFREELEKISDTGKYMQYIQNDDEILANFFDVYVNAPDVLRAEAPLARAAFEKVIDSNADWQFLRDIQPSTNRQMEAIEKDLWGESPFTPPDTIVAYRNGDKKYYKVSKPIADAMKGVSPAQLDIVDGWIKQAVRGSSSMLRWGATHTPEFMLKNTLRDQQNAFIQSNVGLNPSYFMRGFMSALKVDDLYNKWAASGGKYGSYMALDDDTIAKSYQELFSPESALMKYAKNPLRLLSAGAQLSEQSTRIASFNKAKIEGKSDIEAAVESLESTVNFRRFGSLGKKYNPYIPFLNVGLQSSERMVRAFKKNPKAMTFRALATITLPQLLLTGYYLYGADDETRKEYLEFPAWFRAIAWPVKVNGVWIPYPKPFALGYIFGTMPENMMLWMYEGEDKPRGKQIFLDLVKGLAVSVSPIADLTSLIPPAAKAGIEGVTNYNFFTGKQLYQPWMDALPPENRVNAYTSESAKLIGETIGMSPAIIDNAIRAQFGGIGKYGTAIGDKLLNEVKAFNGEQQPTKPEHMTDLPLLRSMFPQLPDGTRSTSYQNFMETYKEISQYKMQSKKIEDRHEFSAYMKTHGQKIKQYEALDASYDRIKSTLGQINEVYDHKTMSAEKKTEKIMKLERSITEEARKANIRFNKATDVK